MSNTFDIRKMINLVESFDRKLEESQIINEANPLVDLAKAGRISKVSLTGTLRAMKNDAIIGQRLKTLSMSEDDLFELIKNNYKTKAGGQFVVRDGLRNLTKKELAEIRGTFEINLLKNPANYSSQVLQAAVGNLVRDERFVAKYADEISQSTNSFSDALKRNGYPRQTTDEILSQMGSKGLLNPQKVQQIKQKVQGRTRNQGGGGGGGNRNQGGGGGGGNRNQGGNIDKSIIDRIKDMMRKKRSWKSLLGWGLGVGIGAPVLWSVVTSGDEEVPEGTPDTQPSQNDLTGWPECIKQLSGQGSVKTDDDDQIYYHVIQTGDGNLDSKGGVRVYPNGNIVTDDNTMSGTYECKGGIGSITEATQIKGLTNTEKTILMDLDDATAGPGTDVGDLTLAISKIKSLSQYNLINNNMSKYTGYNSIQAMLRGELGSGNYSDAREIADHLSKIGLEMTFRKTGYLGGVQGITITGGDATKSEISTDNKIEGGGKSLGNIISVKWSSGSGTGGSSSGGGTSQKSKYKPCDTNNYVKGCKSEQVKKVQACLGFPNKYQTGNFGPITQEALQKLGKGYERGFRDVDVDEICKNSGGSFDLNQAAKDEENKYSVSSFEDL